MRACVWPRLGFRDSTERRGVLNLDKYAALLSFFGDVYCQVTEKISSNRKKYTQYCCVLNIEVNILLSTEKFCIITENESNPLEFLEKGE